MIPFLLMIVLPGLYEYYFGSNKKNIGNFLYRYSIDFLAVVIIGVLTIVPILYLDKDFGKLVLKFEKQRRDLPENILKELYDSYSRFYGRRFRGRMNRRRNRNRRRNVRKEIKLK